MFAFSIRKDIDTGKYTFPLPFDTGVRLKDILEKNVDEKYYVSNDRANNLILQLIEKGQLKGYKDDESKSVLVKNQATEYTRTVDVANTLMARDWKGFGNQDMVAIVESQNLDDQKRLGGLWDGETRHQAGSVWDTNGMSPTLDTCAGGGRQPHIIEEDNNDIVQYNNDTTKPICVGNTTPSGKSQCNAVYSTEGVSQTLCAGTHGYATGNILEETNKINVLGNYMPSNHDASRVVGTDGVAPTVKENHGTVTGILEEQPEVIGIKQATKKGYIECELPGCADFSFPNSKLRRGRVQGGEQIVPTLTAAEGGIRYIESIYRIRKLTVRECFKLMSFEFEDWYKCEAIGISNSAGYRAAGNSIAVCCIQLLFEHLYKAQYDESYICTDEKMQNFTQPEA